MEVTETDSTHYVDNEQLYEELKQHLKLRKRAEKEGIEPPKLPYYVAKSFVDIADGIGKLKSYRNYSFLPEMKGDAILNCMLYYHNFNHRKYKNPFAYFSQFTRWAFHRFIKREARAQYTKYKIAANAGLLDQGLTDSDGNALMSSGTFDNINDFIANYERKMAEEKIAKSKPKGVKSKVVKKTTIRKKSKRGK
jgi:hypothetical protein